MFQNGWSPLLVASEQGHISIVKILLQHHARVDVFDEVDYICINWLLVINLNDMLNETPIRMSTKTCSINKEK